MVIDLLIKDVAAAVMMSVLLLLLCANFDLFGIHDFKSTFWSIFPEDCLLEERHPLRRLFKMSVESGINSFFDLLLCKNDRFNQLFNKVALIQV